MHYEIILESRDNSYIVDRWESTELESWENRFKTAGEKIPDTASPGDVIKYESKEKKLAPSDIATTIQNAHDTFMETVHKYAEEFDATIDGLNNGLSDGDVLFLVDPPEAYLTPITGGEKAFTFPSGIIREDGMTRARYPRLLGHRSDSIDSGLAFDSFRVNDWLIGLRYDAEHSKEISESPGVCQWFDGFSALTHIDSIESEDDLIPPFYVSIDGFDDGQFYSMLYDSGDERNESRKFFDNYRPLHAVEGKPVWKIRDRWQQNGLVPVESVHFDDESKPAPLYVEIDPDADPISAKKTNQR